MSRTSSNNYAKNAWAREYKDRAERERERDLARSERDWFPCMCGAITELDQCPYCGGARAASKAGAK